MGFANNRNSELRKLLLTEFEHSSENLRKYAKGKGKDYCVMVIREGWNNIAGDCDIDKGRLLIGFFCDVGFFNGSQLNQVRCKNFKTWAFMPKNYTDVTEWFMKEYAEKGMCFEGDSNHEFEINHDTRVCKHCCKTQVRKTKMVEKVWWE